MQSKVEDYKNTGDGETFEWRQHTAQYVDLMAKYIPVHLLYTCNSS